MSEKTIIIFCLLFASILVGCNDNNTQLECDTSSAEMADVILCELNMDNMSSTKKEKIVWKIAGTNHLCKNYWSCSFTPRAFHVYPGDELNIKVELTFSYRNLLERKTRKNTERETIDIINTRLFDCIEGEEITIDGISYKVLEEVSNYCYFYGYQDDALCRSDNAHIGCKNLAEAPAACSNRGSNWELPTLEYLHMMHDNKVAGFPVSGDGFCLSNIDAPCLISGNNYPTVYWGKNGSAVGFLDDQELLQAPTDKLSIRCVGKEYVYEY